MPEMQRTGGEARVSGAVGCIWAGAAGLRVNSNIWRKGGGYAEFFSENLFYVLMVIWVVRGIHGRNLVQNDPQTTPTRALKVENRRPEKCL